MALRTPPSWISGQSHTAENDRLTTQGFIATAGVRATNGAIPQAAGATLVGDLAVVPSATPGKSVVVKAGWAYVKGTVSGTQGMYGVYNDNDVTLTIASNTSGSPRTDAIYLQVTDVNYGDSTSTVQLLVQSPYSTLPDSSLLLGTVTVASGYTSITAAQITDSRVPYTTAAAVHPIYTLNEQTGTTYTLNINDQDKMVSFDNSGGTTVTVPDNVFPVGATINLMQAGASGTTQVSATNLKYAVGTKLRVQWSVATLYQYKLNYWVLTGDTKA